MTNAGKSVFYFGIYLYAVGLLLLFFPNFFLKTLFLPETQEVWIRVVGVLAFVLGYYYQRAGSKNLTHFFPYTVHGRIFAFIAFTGFVVLKLISPIFILIAAIDLAGAAWTWWSIKKDGSV